jgi:hypothetical protein
MNSDPGAGCVLPLLPRSLWPRSRASRPQAVVGASIDPPTGRAYESGWRSVARASAAMYNGKGFWDEVDFLHFYAQKTAKKARQRTSRHFRLLLGSIPQSGSLARLQPQQPRFAGASFSSVVVTGDGAILGLGL